MFKKIFCFLLFCITLSSCHKGQKVDLIVHNAVVYTMDENNQKWEAIAIVDGEIIEVGPERQILNKYRAEEYIDVKGKEINPGFTLVNYNLYDEVQNYLYQDFSKVKSILELSFLIERTIDSKQNVFIGKNLSDNFFDDNQSDKTTYLTKFGNKTILIFNPSYTKVLTYGLDGTQTVKILTDKSQIDFIKNRLPKYSHKELISVFSDVQMELFQNGVVAINDLAIDENSFVFYEKISKLKKLDLFLSGAIFDIDLSKKVLYSGFYKANNFLIRSITNDLSQESFSKEKINFCLLNNLQFILKSPSKEQITLFLKHLEQLSFKKMELRWRIEEIKEITHEDLKKMSEFGLYPSVDFSASTVASNDLKKSAGIVISQINDLYDRQLMFEKMSQAALGSKLSTYDYFKSITNSNVYAIFQERKFGTIKAGYDATFTVLDKAIINGKYSDRNFAIYTFIKGKKVYSFE